ncbi:MAG: iron ABC transporter substrate-binding protein [Actinomycetota bacterium]
MARRIIIIGLALLALTAASCSTPNREAKPGGNKTPSGAITVYSGREKDLVAPLYERFTAATGITVNARYGDTAELAAQILEEGSGSPADVFFAQDAGGLGAVSARGLFEPLEEAITNKVESRFRASDRSWVGVSGRARVAVYNTETLKREDLPTSILGFTDPKWKGKIGWAPTNGSFQAFVTGLRILKGDDAARAWLRGLKANDAQVYPKNTPIVEAVNAGEIQVGFVNHYYVLEMMKDNPAIKAANYFFSGGDPGSLVNVAGVGIVKTSHNEAAARRFVEYLLETEAQEFFATETFEYPLVAGIKADPRLPALTALEPPAIDLSQLKSLEATLTMLKDENIL